MKGNIVNNSIASIPAAINTIVASPQQIRKVIQWLTVRHPEGAVASYPMFSAPEGLAWLEMHELLRPEDKVIAVTPCTEQFLVIETNGQLDMGTTVEEVQSWVEVSNESPEKRPLGWHEYKSAEVS
jgi:flavin-binding protein dodecin